MILDFYQRQKPRLPHRHCPAGWLSLLLLATLAAAGCSSTRQLASVPGFGWLANGEEETVLDPTASYPAPSASTVPSSLSPAVQLPGSGTHHEIAAAPGSTHESPTTSPSKPGYPETGYPAFPRGSGSRSGSHTSPNLSSSNPFVQQGLYSQSLHAEHQAEEADSHPPHGAHAGAYPESSPPDGSSSGPPSTSFGTPPIPSSPMTAANDSVPKASPNPRGAGRDSVFPGANVHAIADTPAGDAPSAQSIPTTSGGVAGNPMASLIPSVDPSQAGDRPTPPSAESEPSVYDTPRTAGRWQPGSTTTL